jgi:hypothetical protein
VQTEENELDQFIQEKPAGEVAQRLEHKAMELDRFASETPSRFIRAIYQAQAEILRQTAAEFA